jgi:hypothetical protein
MLETGDVVDVGVQWRSSLVLVDYESKTRREKRAA